jgi:hypothetical protein
MGANVFSRPRPQRDLVRMFVQVKCSPFDSVRRQQTPGTALDFPDTEEVTGSNPVRPTRFFEILSSAESQDGSQAPAVLPNKRWSRRGHSGLYTRCPSGFGQLEAHSRGFHRVRHHAASRTSRTVNAARHAHIADSVLEVCLGATPVHGVHIGDSGAKPLPARKGLTGLRLCVTGRNSEPATSAICPCTPDFGAARCADRTCTAADGRREERSQTGSLVARRSP